MKRWHTLLVGVFVSAGLVMPTRAQEDTNGIDPEFMEEMKTNLSAEQLDHAVGRMSRSAPMVADMAPVFKLKSLDGKSETDVASFRGVRPIVLFFGSYT